MLLKDSEKNNNYFHKNFFVKYFHSLEYKYNFYQQLFPKGLLLYLCLLKSKAGINSMLYN